MEVTHVEANGHMKHDGMYAIYTYLYIYINKGSHLEEVSQFNWGGLIDQASTLDEYYVVHMSSSCTWKARDQHGEGKTEWVSFWGWDHESHDLGSKKPAVRWWAALAPPELYIGRTKVAVTDSLSKHRSFGASTASKVVGQDAPLHAVLDEDRWCRG